MIVYIVLADTLDAYGSDFHIFLTTIEEERAIKKYIELEKRYGIKNVQLRQVVIEVDCDIEIGG